MFRHTLIEEVHNKNCGRACHFLHCNGWHKHRLYYSVYEVNPYMYVCIHISHLTISYLPVSSIYVSIWRLCVTSLLHLSFVFFLAGIYSSLPHNVVTRTTNSFLQHHILTNTLELQFRCTIVSTCILRHYFSIWYCIAYGDFLSLGSKTPLFVTYQTFEMRTQPLLHTRNAGFMCSWRSLCAERVASD